jgi:hypothetical protein
VKVDWQTYYDAAKQCHNLADDLRRADKPVHVAVKGDCAGMAGDAPGCKEWGKAYDTAAQQTMQTCSSLANALTNYGAALYAMGYNYGIANKSNPAPTRPDISQVGEYKVVIPTSVADNGIGLADHGSLKEFFDKLVAKVLSTFGKLPNGDAAKLDKAHTTWNSFSGNPTITGAAARISAISATFDGMDDHQNLQLIQDHFATLKDGADAVTTAAKNVAAPVGSYHDATVSLGNNTASAINTLETSLAITAAVGVALALFSLGTSAVAAEGAMDFDIAATISAIQTTFRTSQMARIIGLTALAAGAVGVVDAFHAVPSDDLEKAIAKLSAIIAMKVLIDEENDHSTEQDFRHSEYTEAEIEEFINGHTGDGNPTMDRPTQAQVHDALTKGTPKPMGDGRPASEAEQFVYNGVKVVVNYKMPWKSTAWKL